MAQLKDTIITGDASITGTLYPAKIQGNTLWIPTSSGGTTYGAGTSGQVLKTNGTTVYWASDSNSDTWRNIQVNGTQILGTATNTGALNLKSGTNVTVSNSSGTVTFNGPSTAASHTTGISIANHGTGTVIGVQSTTTSVTGVSGSTTVRGVKTGTGSTTTASKASGGNGSASTWTFEEKSIPNVTSAGSASTWTFEEKSIPNVTAAGSGSFGATVLNHVLSFSHAHTAPTLGTAIKVQSKSGGGNGTAPTLGTAIKVQSKSGGGNGTAPTWSFTDVTVPIMADADTTVPKAASSATTVPIKNSSASTFVTGTTHTITDNGHTHTLS